MRIIHANKNSFRLIIHTFSALLIISLLFLPPASHAQATGNGIEYHGGPVMNTVPTSTTTVYLIWYGNWSSNSALTLLPSFISSLSNTPYFAINTTYGYTPSPTPTPTPANASAAITLGTQVFDHYSQGTSLTDTSVKTIVSNAISSLGLPMDPNGVYFVLSSGDVTETGTAGTFCTNFCGFHGHASLGVSKSDIKYAFVGDADQSIACISGCTGDHNVTGSPNGNPGADEMANLIAHELSETVTDPDVNAWFHNSGLGENADLCNQNFGPTFTASNGVANITLGGKNYLIQQLWLNDGGGGCTMASSGNPFMFDSAEDELQACNGIAEKNSSQCASISDLNDRLTCSAIATVSQTPCKSMTDRNLQLSCYGMSVSPNFPTNCRDITNPQMQAFCYGAANGNIINSNVPVNCNNVTDVNARALCLGIALHESSQCSAITNQSDRQFCVAVSSSNSASCASIVTCPDPRGQATCVNNGKVWDTSSCSCSPACNPNLQQICINKGGSWNSSTCTCTGGCGGTGITCAQVNPIAQGQASTPLPPTELKSRFPLGIASPAPSPIEK